jgi:hypothetical protein
MASGIYTGGSASLGYGFETAFGTEQTTIGNIFGLNQKVTNLSLNTSQIILNKLGQVEPTKFAFGQQQGSLGVGFVFDDIESHKIFRCLYENTGSTPQSSSPFSYPSTSAPAENQTGVITPASLTTRIQVNAGSGNLLTRTLKGCIVNSVGISTSIGEVVNGTVDMAFAEESTTDISTNGTYVPQTTVNSSSLTPYTFAHGELKAPTGGTALQTIFDIQDVDITFSPNTELLWGLGSHYAQNAFRRVFDIGGRFRTTFKDGTLLQYVIDQSIKGAKSIAAETLAETSSVGLSLTFTNAGLGTGGKSLKLEFGGVSLADHSNSGIEPAEPIFEELNWKAKSSKITVDTT